MPHKSNTLKGLRRSLQFLSERDYRQERQFLPRFPAARMEKDRIVWTPDPDSLHRPRRSRAEVSFQQIPNDLYLRFVDLSEGADKDILAFAGRWGPLRVRDLSEGEPISNWHDFPRLAAALLHAAVALAGGPACHQDHCTTIGKWAYQVPEWRPDADQYLLRGGVAASLNRWYNEPAVHQGLVNVVGDRILIQPASDGLFGVLVTQLACVICGTHRKAVCSACGCGFFPKRYPSPGRRQYCPLKKCKKAGHRQAVLEYRQRKKAIP